MQDTSKLTQNVVFIWIYCFTFHAVINCKNMSCSTVNTITFRYMGWKKNKQIFKERD